MNYSEELLWILDKPGTTIHNQDEQFKENIAFVHSLGLKCDCVGWCKLDLSNPRTPEILNCISKFCNKNGWHARGIYTRQYVDVKSDWYELVPVFFKDNTLCDTIETVMEDGGKIKTSVIRAFHELTPTAKRWGNGIYIPERFRNFCLQNNIDGLDFCWAKDKGKYKSEQYFHLYGKRLIPHIAVDFDLNEHNTAGIQAAGGWLPEISNIFHTLQKIILQDCYLASDLPDRGIVYAYIPTTFSCVGCHTILIHKTIAQSLIQNKVLPSNALRPAPVVKELPGGYSLRATQSIERPTALFMDKMLSEYETLKDTPRPIRMVTEKESLKVLRLAKKERKEDFQKAMTKDKTQSVIDTDYRALIPYYTITNGSFLSDEYEFLPFAQAMKENEEFQAHLASEELLDVTLEGIVIAKCPDGDHILLRNCGDVVRVSHEAPEITEHWPSLAQFFVDTINE